jgi:hypothetical protein
MKAKDIKVGGRYKAKVSGVMVTVRVDAVRQRQGYKRMETVFDVTNLKTGRKTTFGSAAKFLGPALDGHLLPALKKTLVVPEIDPLEAEQRPVQDCSIVQVVYGDLSLKEIEGVTTGYAFYNNFGPVNRGDVLDDGMQNVTVVGFGRNGYTGPIRSLSRRVAEARA